MTYVVFAADPKRLLEGFTAGRNTFVRYHTTPPAVCRAHPETVAALIARGVDPTVELIPDPRLARLNLYFGPLPEGTR